METYKPQYKTHNPEMNLKRSRRIHLDHIFPIQKGYIYNVPPEEIGNIKNLRLIPYNKNISKGNKILLEEMNEYTGDLIAKYIE